MDSSKSEESVIPPPGPNTVKPAMSVSPKPRTCLKRKDDTYVPLIAIDELPTWLRLEGVPLTLRGQEVLDLGMINCGDQPKINNDCYHIELTEIPSDIHTCSKKDGYESGSSSPDKEPVKSIGKVFVAPDKKAMESDEKVTKVDEIRAKIAEIMSNPEDSPEPIRNRGTPGTLGKKVYCTYWIRTGNCNYMQEGCKYLHEIPPDVNTRVAIGVRTFPTWARDDPTGPPQPVKWQGPTAMLQQSWRRQVDNHIQYELPEASKHGHGHGCTRSPIAAPVPRPGQNKSNGLLNGSYVPPIAASMQAPVLYPQSNFLAPQQQYFSSQANSSGQQVSHSPFNSFGDAFHVPDAAPEEPRSHHFLKATLPSNTPSILGMNGRYQSPPTQPPISRPVFGMQPLNPSPANGGSPFQIASSGYATPQANTPVNSSGNGYNQYVGFDNKRKATNNCSPNSRSSTPASSNANTAITGNGNNSSSFNALRESTASPPILHRRLFVPDGEPRYVANPIGDGHAKPQHKARRTATGKGKAHGHGKGGQSNKGYNHGMDSLI